MTKPIGQTFFINEPPPPTGVDGVFLTKIDIFFKSVSSVYGIEIQIRETDNGTPTSNRLPFGSKIILPDSGDLHASDDASVATTFEFDTPVFLKSNVLYAFVLIPLGGNPDYNVWTAEISQNDVTTNSPIFTNNNSGDLFLSSNDLSWIPIITEDIKYNLYIANFTSTSGEAVFKSPNEEWFTYNNPSGSFIPREALIFGNTPMDAAYLTVANVLGTFVNGDIVFQSDGITSVYGTVYNSNSTTIRLSNVTGVFAQTTNANTLLRNSNSTSNAVVNLLLQNNIVTLSSNQISVPDSSIYTANNVLYVQTSNRSNTTVVQVTSVPNSTIIQVNAQVPFNDSHAIIGRVIANGYLTGRFTQAGNPNGINGTYMGIIDNSSSNSSVNLANVENKKIQVIGVISGVSANLLSIFNPSYDALTTSYITSIPSNTSINWEFTGFKNDTLKTPDSSSIPIINGLINEFIDIERSFMSRSNEIANLPGGRAGNSSLVVSSTLSTANSKISPAIDTIRDTVTLTMNKVLNANQISGFILTFTTPNSGIIGTNDIIQQSVYGNTSYGTVYSSNSSSIVLININGTFIPNTAFTSVGGYSGKILTATKFGEDLNVNSPDGSRYISKNVILSTGQDSEDMMVYLDAYRPSNCDVYVYTKLINAADNESFDSKHWSKLTEASGGTLRSSKANIDDLVELQYGLNTSQLIFDSAVSTSNASQNVSISSTSLFSNGDFIYLRSDDTNLTFNVRQIIYVVNSTSITIDRNPSFTSTNAAIGLIPGVECTSAAFLYDENSNIVRYVTPSDVVYDNYIQFAMKIVPVSDVTSIVPRVGDIRTISLQK